MPAEVKRKIMKHGQYSGVVALPTSYRRYNKLGPGDEVKVYYDSLVLIVPRNLEHIVQRKKHLVDAILRQ